jgi:hypothetical protein
MGERMGQLPDVEGVASGARWSSRSARCWRHHQKEVPMKRFMIEREIPGASELSQAALADIAQASNDVVAGLDVPYTWVNSYVAGDKIYCVHETEDVEAVLEHARRGGFPANTVSVVANEFGPQTAALAGS